MLGFGLSLIQPAITSAVVVVAGTTWDAAASSTDYVLSNGNLTASRPSGAGDAVVKGSAARTSGYFEVVPTIVGGNAAIGLTTAADGTGTFLGDGAGSIGYFSSGAVFDNNGTTVTGTWASFTSSDVMGVCFKAGKVYFSKNGTWQNSADPSAGTGGVDVSGFLTNALPAASTNNFNSFAAHFTTGFSGTIPTGVTAWT